MRSLLIFLLSVPLFTLSGCQTDTPAPLFDQGGPAELVEAEARALDHLAATGSPAMLKGVDSVRVTRARLDGLKMAHVKVQQELRGVPETTRLGC